MDVKIKQLMRDQNLKQLFLESESLLSLRIRIHLNWNGCDFFLYANLVLVIVKVLGIGSI